MTAHCFTYGSLMCEDIMSAVCGTACNRHEPATLIGHRRHPVIGQHYPGMVPAAGSTVAGVLYLDLPASAWPRLDAFEGEEYTREAVTVALSDSRSLTAWTYVFKPQYAGRLATGDWDFEHFLRYGKTGFEAAYLGFSAVQGNPDSIV
ncbi:MAG: gamma-glutamylcyclotransferase [Thauera sp.]|nr:gamma-glutamylcyclotransferase [Thauera sp.]